MICEYDGPNQCFLCAGCSNYYDPISDACKNCPNYGCLVSHGKHCEYAEEGY